MKINKALSLSLSYLRKPGYAAPLRMRGNYFRPNLSIPRVGHRGEAYQ